MLKSVGKTAGETGDAADSQTQEPQLLPKGNRHRSDDLVQGNTQGPGGLSREKDVGVGGLSR